MDIDADQDEDEPIFPHKHFVMSINWKIMMGSAIFMCLVMFILLILHIYTRFVMRNRARLQEQSTADQPKTGLDPNVLASLPVFAINDQGQDCSVCLSVLEIGKIAKVLPKCKHIFHVECIDKWLSGQSTCPICRAEVVSRS